MKIFQKTYCLFMLLMIISGCYSNVKKQTADEILKDSVKQKEIFHAICSDSTQMMQFMQYMMQNKTAMQMMAGNHEMMSSMMGNQQMMMNEMKGDTSMCEMMPNKGH